MAETEFQTYRLTLISAVSRAMELLELLADGPEGVSVTALARRTGVGKSIVSRILTTLADSGYVLRDSQNDRYRLALKAVSIGNRYAERCGFPDIATPVLQRLARESGELVQLGVVEGDSMRFVAKAEGNRRIRMLALLGQEVPLHASSMGKVWLASLPEDRALAIVARRGLRAFTPKTITGMSPLLAELKLTADRGYGVVVEEIMEDAGAVARPVAIGQPPQVVGAVSIAGPMFRLTSGRIAELADLLVPAVTELAAIWPRDLLRAPPPDPTPKRQRRT